MKYTVDSFKRQTCQDFYYLINYDEGIGKFLDGELKKYPKLPDNIILTPHYYQEMEK